MIKFYLTGASKPNEYQPRPDRSLGGYISTAEVVNGDPNGLFGDITEFSKQDRDHDHCLIAVRNETNAAISNMEFIVTNAAESVADIDIALVIPSTDSGGNYLFEKIASKKAVPLYATFDDGAGVTLPSLGAGAYVGVWLRRKVKDSTYVKPTAAQLSANLDSGIFEQTDTASLTIEY